MGNPFHGVMTVEYLAGPVPILAPRSAVIGLVGTAPVHELEDPADLTLNTIVMCTNETDDAKYFGVDTAGYTIPSALKAIRAQLGGVLVMVTNVFDPDTHLTLGVPDPATVVAADIVGTTSGGGVRSGTKTWLNARAQFGFGPRIMIVPGWGSNVTVMVAVRALMSQLRGVDIADAAVGLTPSAVITSRTTSGDVFFTSADRSILCYPHLKATGPDGELTNQPMSQFLAGVIAAKDTAVAGPHWSPSNTVIQGVTDVERLLTASLNDGTCEVDLLNAAGIATYFPHSGIRSWGNRSAAYPTDPAATSFIPVRRTADIIEDAIEAAQMRYMDRPLTIALMDQVVDDVSGFLREKQGEGWIIDGRCWVDKSDNPLTVLAAGRPVYRYDFMPPVANERPSFKAIINTEYLNSLVGV